MWEREGRAIRTYGRGREKLSVPIKNVGLGRVPIKCERVRRGSAELSESMKGVGMGKGRAELSIPMKGVGVGKGAIRTYEGCRSGEEELSVRYL